ncbi:hypothetical protein Vca1114GL_04730 [Vibrio campbellii]|uniref:hypothetical protein n=1 Tax=Vibrio campbellii TaxID=680 RepID=UPI00097FAC67|nr:hypothetical protein [Vibrio campbellii]AQM71147.1 hypothetical protein Vca1114GL_04730 [Vibrio campbellii]
MLNTKSKLLALLEEFEIDHIDCPPNGVFVYHEDDYPFGGDDWTIEFDVGFNFDGATHIYVNRKTETLVLVYDALASGSSSYYECLVFGDTSDFEGMESLDVRKYSLWYTREYDYDYIEFLCPHLVLEMKFEDDDNRDQKNSVLEIDFDALTEERISELKSQGLIQKVDSYLDNVRYQYIDDNVIAMYGCEPKSDDNVEVEKLGENQYKLTFHDLEFLRDRDIVMACGEYDDYQRTQEAIVRRGWWFNGF